MRTTTALVGWAVAVVGAAGAGCQSARAPSVVAAPITGATWAGWPMPNARQPGLPNPHSYDTRTAGVVADRVTGLMWQRNLSNEFLSWDKALQACDRLTLAGHDDWRLPSRIELVSLVDITRIEPSIDIDAFPGTPNEWFWTSSPAIGEPSAAWYVYFYFGYPKTDDVTNAFSVRCVRSTRAPPALPTRYDTRDGEIGDLATGLRWQRVVSSESLSFRSAQSYCENLTLSGKKRWRLPTLVELLTLIDERAATTPMIDRTAFPDTPGEQFWTSSTFASGAELAWYVRFDRGDGLYGRLTERFRVRCVL